MRGSTEIARAWGKGAADVAIQTAKMNTACLRFGKRTQDIYSPLVHTQKYGPAGRDPHRSWYDTSKQRTDSLRQIYLSKSMERREVFRMGWVLCLGQGEIFQKQDWQVSPEDQA
jgi:hypothetical protein